MRLYRSGSLKRPARCETAQHIQLANASPRNTLSVTRALTSCPCVTLCKCEFMRVIAKAVRVSAEAVRVSAKAVRVHVANILWRP
jgi:hypothetical protein